MAGSPLPNEAVASAHAPCDGCLCAVQPRETNRRQKARLHMPPGTYSSTGRSLMHKFRSYSSLLGSSYRMPKTILRTRWRTIATASGWHQLVLVMHM